MATNPIPFPTLSNQFVEFRRPNRSMESRKIVVQGTQNSVAASYLSTANDTRATYFARGDYTVIPVTASPLPVKTSLDYVDSTAVVAVALPDPTVVNDTLVNGIVKTIFTDGTNAVTVTPGTGDIAVIPAVVGANVTYMWDSTRWTIIGQGTTAVGPLTMPDGTAAAPGLAFTLDPDTGFYRIGANDMGISTGGTLALEANATQDIAVPNGQILASDGAVGAPAYSFGNDTTTGIHYNGANDLSIDTNGAQSVYVNSVGDVDVLQGNVIVTPAARFVNHPGSGTAAEAGGAATLNTRTGRITHAAVLGAGAGLTVTVANTTVGLNSHILVVSDAVSAIAGIPATISVVAITAGVSFQYRIYNSDGVNATTAAPNVEFVIINI